jgi:hypothetical protein
MLGSVSAVSKNTELHKKPHFREQARFELRRRADFENSTRRSVRSSCTDQGRSDLSIDDQA